MNYNYCLNDKLRKKISIFVIKSFLPTAERTNHKWYNQEINYDNAIRVTTDLVMIVLMGINEDNSNYRYASTGGICVWFHHNELNIYCTLEQETFYFVGDEE